MSDNTAPPPEGTTPPPAGAAGYDAVEAIKYGWARFSHDPATLLVPTIVIVLIIAVVEVVAQLVFAGIFLGDPECKVSITDTAISSECDGPGFFAGLFVAAVVAGIGTFVVHILMAGLVKSTLNIADGLPGLSIAEVFAWASKPAVVTTAAFLAVLSFVSTLLFYLPAIIIGFLTAFTLYFVVDQGLVGVAAIKASFTFVTSQFSSTVVFMVLGAIAVIAGLIACVIGVFVALPVVMIAAAYTFRVLHGRPVAPVA